MRCNIFFIGLIAIMLFTCCEKNKVEPVPESNPGPVPETPVIPNPDPNSKVLYNGIVLPSSWPPFSSSSANIYAGMDPAYLKNKPEVIDITIGRQLFVDDFLIDNTSLKREWYQAQWHTSNPVFEPQTEWEMLGNKGGGFAAPFSDGIWYDEVDNKFKMWYMAGGKTHGDGNQLTCYAESIDGINWTRPNLNVVPQTNIVHKGKKRDSYTVWLDKTEKNSSYRYKMFGVYGGAGNWKYHYLTSSDGKAWREQNESKLIADRSTVFHNPFRGVWVWSMRHNVRVDASNLVRARDYYENADPVQGNISAEADLKRFWFGPWPNEPKHDIYTSIKPAIYNTDAIAYESIMLGTFSVWSGPENDVCASDNVIKRNQLLLGYSRDGWNWHRENFIPFCATNSDKSAWNNGNIQSAVGSPIIVNDKLYFYMSGRRLNENGAEITTTGLATLRRDGFASMSGSGELVTEKIKFTGNKLYVNVNIRGSLRVELLDEKGNLINGYSKDECLEIKSNSTKQLIEWKNKKDLSSISSKIIKLKFYVDNGDIYSFWVSQFDKGQSYGYTAGGGPGLSQYGIDIN